MVDNNAERGSKISLIETCKSFLLEDGFEGIDVVAVGEGIFLHC